MILSGRNGQFHHGKLNPSGKLCRDPSIVVRSGKGSDKTKRDEVGEIDVIVGGR